MIQKNVTWDAKRRKSRYSLAARRWPSRLIHKFFNRFVFKRDHLTVRIVSIRSQMDVMALASYQSIVFFNPSVRLVFALNPNSS